MNSYSFRIIVCCALALVAGAATSQELARALPMDQQLSALAQTGLPGPVVVALNPDDRQSPAQQPPTSLKAIASNLGLKVFEQDGVYVIAPETRAEYAKLFDAAPLGQSEPLDLVHSLSDAQFRQMGSQQGLSFSGLDGRQRTMLAAMFRAGNVVTKGDDTTNGFDHGPAVPAETLPLQSARLSAWLEVSDLAVYFPNGSWQAVPSGESATTGLMLTAVDSESDDQSEPLLPHVPNTVKPSDLDYADAALGKTVSLDGRVSLADFIDRVAKETGVDLHGSPGSDKVFLFISASNVSAGRLLKAVSLATTGTWRRFGDACIFSFDRAGLGQIEARVTRVWGDALTNWAGSSYLAARKLGNLGLLAALPYAPNTKFAPDLDQASYLLDGGNSDGPHLFWSQLTADQQTYLEQELAKYARRELRAAPSERAFWKIGLTVKMNMACSLPNAEHVLLPIQESSAIATDFYVGACGSQGITILPADVSARNIPAYLDAPPKLSIAVSKPLRGYMCRPSARETPDELIATMTKHGLNALYLRVFSNGFTAFDSQQFPKLPDLDSDYLLKVISKAHERGIAVIGVVDVLRWSDGSKGSWVSKQPDMLDYDVFGRTHAEFGKEFADWIAAQPDVVSAGYRLETADYGDGFTGDAVSPYSPEVKSKLLGLLDELAKYELDGLMLDYTTMRQVLSDSTDFGSAWAREGRPGHASLERLEFFRAHGADSVDIPTEDADVMRSPLTPIAKACSALQPAWDESYRRGCDDLLESLAKKWAELRKSAIRNPQSDMPLRVLVTFRAGTQTHDWPKFKDLLEGVAISGTDFPGKGGTYYGFKSTPIVRASDQLGTLPFASVLAAGLGCEFDGIMRDGVPEKPWESDGVILDMTSSGRRKADYLKLISPPTKNR